MSVPDRDRPSQVGGSAASGFRFGRRALLGVPKAFRFTYALRTSTPHRLRFTLPRGRLFALACVALAIGAPLLLQPGWFRGVSPALVVLAGWSGVAIFVGLATMVLTHRGELVVDAASRTVRLDFRVLREHTQWIRPFTAFTAIETRQVKDGHGLHNHWQIALVADDGTRVLVGYGLLGAVRARARDHLTSQLAALLEIPVEHVEA